MRWLRGETPDSSFERLWTAFQASSLKTRLMLGLIPPVVLIMMITGYVTYLISKQSIGNAIQRTSRLQTVAVRNEIEGYLERCRQDINHLAQENITPEVLHRFIAKQKISGGIEYLEVAYIAQKRAGHLIYMAKNDQIVQIAADRSNPALYLTMNNSKKSLRGRSGSHRSWKSSTHSRSRTTRIKGWFAKSSRWQPPAASREKRTDT